MGSNPKSSARAKRPPRTYPSSGVYGTYPSSGMYVVGWLHARSNQPHPSEISDGLVGNSSCPINGAMLENLSRVVGPLSLGTLPVCEHYVCEREPNCTYPSSGMYGVHTRVRVYTRSPVHTPFGYVRRTPIGNFRWAGREFQLSHQRGGVGKPEPRGRTLKSRDTPRLRTLLLRTRAKLYIPCSGMYGVHNRVRVCTRSPVHT